MKLEFDMIVYHKDMHNGRTSAKIVGMRKEEIELEYIDYDDEITSGWYSIDSILLEKYKILPNFRLNNIPDDINECFSIIKTINYTECEFLYDDKEFYLVYNYTNNKWSCGLNSPKSFKLPKFENESATKVIKQFLKYLKEN